jgi:hypothetical protein
MGGKSAKQQAQTGTCGYWPYANFLGNCFPNVYNNCFAGVGTGLDCFSPFNSFANCGFGNFGFGGGFVGFNGISPLALPFNSALSCCQPTQLQTHGKLNMVYNGSKFNLKW